MTQNGLSTPLADAPLASVQADLRAASQRPFEEARPIPPVSNHSLQFAAHERERIFSREWICVGRVDEVTAAGDYLVQDIAGVPVLVVR